MGAPYHCIIISQRPKLLKNHGEIFLKSHFFGVIFIFWEILWSERVLFMENPTNYSSTGPADQKIFDDFRCRVDLSADLLQRVKKSCFCLFTGSSTYFLIF